MNAESISPDKEPNANALTTAYALGELTAEERAAFEQQMESDAALATLARETKDFCALLDGSLRDPVPSLAEENRTALLAAASRKPRKHAVWVPWLAGAAAACIAVGGYGYYSSNQMAYRGSVEREATMGTAARPSDDDSGAWTNKNELSAAKIPLQKRDGRRELAQKPSTMPVGLVGGSVSNGKEGDLETPELGDKITTGKMLASTTPQPATVAPPPMVPAEPMDMAAAPGMVGSGGGRGRGMGAGIGKGIGGGWAPGSGAGFGGPPDLAKLKAREKIAEPSSDVERGIYAPRRPESAGSESYAQTTENPFLATQKAPLSTFSIDVDTASYSNVRRFLSMGQRPPVAAVRLEELVNYFPYDYAQPVDGKPFAVHVEMTSAPWDENHRLARIALKGKEIHAAERPAANLVFLVDVSGSMEPENKLPLVKQSLRFLVEKLTDKDTVSLVTYAVESGVALPATNGGDKQRILAAISELGAGGSTNGAGGITTAYQQASLHFNKEGVNRVVLATDGDFNVGVTSREALLDLITDKAKTGVFLSVLGYGMGNTKDDTMELLADKGNGNYAYIDSLSEARKSLSEQFAGTLVTIAKDVKIQIEFNPAIIRSYRLLGYENRMLAKEDFNNDKKDAGEIGAGHTVTALYELVPVGAPEPQVAVDDLKYQPKPAEPAALAPPPVAEVPGNGETMNIKLRWKAPDADVSQLMEVPVKDTGAKIDAAAPETKWAVAVAGFAAMLNGSQFNGLTWEQIRTLAKAGKGNDPNGYRGEFLQLLDRAESVRR